MKVPNNLKRSRTSLARLDVGCCGVAVPSLSREVLDVGCWRRSRFPALCEQVQRIEILKAEPHFEVEAEYRRAVG
jgi:hypothetical protein